MKLTAIAHSLSALSLTLAGSASFAAVPANYKLIDVPDPNGCYDQQASANYGFGISPNSQFVTGRGENECVSGSIDRGFRRDLSCGVQNCMVDLQLVYSPGQSSESRAVLDTGMSVGWGDRLVSGSYVKRPAVFAPGVFNPMDIGSLDTITTTHGIAWSIDSSKNIVGESTTSQGLLRATYWQETSSGSNVWATTNLGALSGDIASSALSKNSNHNVVGWSKDTSNVARPVVWIHSAGSWTINQLPLPSPATSGAAHDINDSNTIVGWAEPFAGERHAIRWTYANNQWTASDLGTLGGNLSEAYSVNISGDIVGKSRTSTTTASERAFLWSGGTMYNLNTDNCHYVLVSANTTATWTLREAWDINSAGAIAGWGVRTGPGSIGTNDKAIVLIPLACDADVNGDGFVGVDDLLAVINNWGETTCQAADITGNLVIDVDDLLAVINDWDCPRPLEERESPPQDIMDCIERYAEDSDRLEACVETILRTGN